MKPVPVTMLSGFLGAGDSCSFFTEPLLIACCQKSACLLSRSSNAISCFTACAGKTTLLRHVLQNSDLKVGAADCREARCSCW